MVNCKFNIKMERHLDKLIAKHPQPDVLKEVAEDAKVVHSMS